MITNLALGRVGAVVAEFRDDAADSDGDSQECIDG
jgi:hypothetical protein